MMSSKERNWKNTKQLINRGWLVEQKIMIFWVFNAYNT